MSGTFCNYDRDCLGAMPEPYERHHLAANPAATAALAEALSPALRLGDVVALRGVLGTGKTLFARAIIQALGEPGEVPSPTFTLVQIYDQGPIPVWHFDLFRIAKAEEIYELGIEDAFVEAITLIEWPERLGALTPANRLEITFDSVDDPQSRRLTMRGHGDWAARLRDLHHV